MEFNDGSQYRVLTNVAAYTAAGRDLYAYRATSARNGALYVDSAFSQHRAATANLRGTLIYQFAYAAWTPEEQAKYLVKTLGNGLQTQEMICLDMESGGGFNLQNAASFVQRWLASAESALQTKAWVYVPGALSRALSPAVTGDRIIWAPRYSGTAQRGTAPNWQHDVHQYTDRGFFPGCSQTGDTNYTTMTTEAMLARCNPSGYASPNGS
jgi:GH25 family lysozyme M1 (1,4-beta-N-acetylmuramidase)